MRHSLMFLPVVSSSENFLPLPPAALIAVRKAARAVFVVRRSPARLIGTGAIMKSLAACPGRLAS
jgi:hypothetical protein